MKTQTLEDGSRRLHVEEWERIPLGPSGLSEDELDALIQSWVAASGRSPEAFFQFGRRTVRPRNWSGVLRAPTVEVQVVPRGAGNLAPEDLDVVDRSLNDMIDYCMATEYGSLEGGHSTGEARLDWAVRSLVRRTLLALRVGRPRRYRSQVQVSKTIRGRLDPLRSELIQMRRPAYCQSSYTELSDDVAELRYVKGVLLSVRAAVSRPVRRGLDALLVELEEVPTPLSPAAERRSVRVDARNTQWQGVIALADDILSRRLASRFVGEASGGASVVLTSVLFEQFIGELARELVPAVAVQAELGPGTWEETSPLEPPSAEPFIVDLVVGSRAGTQVAADTKWKRVRLDRPSYGLQSGDIQQLLAYSRLLGGASSVVVAPWMGDVTPFDSVPRLASAAWPGEGGSAVHLVLVPMLTADVVNAGRQAVQQLIEILAEANRTSA